MLIRKVCVCSASREREEKLLKSMRSVELIQVVRLNIIKFCGTARRVELSRQLISFTKPVKRIYRCRRFVECAEIAVPSEAECLRRKLLHL